MKLQHTPNFRKIPEKFTQRMYRWPSLWWLCIAHDYNTSFRRINWEICKKTAPDSSRTAIIYC